MSDLVTVLTASTGRPELNRCIESVAKQTHRNVQHLIFADGPPAIPKVKQAGYTASIRGYKVDIVPLPQSVGTDRWNGHRMYGAGCYLAEGDYVMFLDDDNSIDPDHIQNCLDAIRYKTPQNNRWVYTLRKIVDTNGSFLCYDDCESLGDYATVMHPSDHLIDVNCYFLHKSVAVTSSPLWYTKARQQGQMEVDRVLCLQLKRLFPDYVGTGKYTVNYAVGGNALSVAPEFFIKGNAEMLRRHNGVLPWKR